MTSPTITNTVNREDEIERDPPRICKVTGNYCTGLFCDDYGCAKEAGFYDEDE